MSGSQTEVLCFGKAREEHRSKWAHQSPALGHAPTRPWPCSQGRRGMASARLVAALKAEPEGVDGGGLLPVHHLKETLPGRKGPNAAFLYLWQSFLKSSGRPPLS